MTERKRGGRGDTRRVTPRLTSCAVRPEPEHGFSVVIRGQDLYGGITPPRVIVGGVPVEDLVLAPDGTAMRGRLEKRPRSVRVTAQFVTGLVELAAPPKRAKRR